MSDPGAVEARRARWLFTSVAVGFTLMAGAAFVFKIIEFLYTLEAPEAEGFVTVPVTVYFIVAAGYLALLVWSWLNGDFERIEEPKFIMLEREAEYERLERQGRRV